MTIGGHLSNDKLRQVLPVVAGLLVSISLYISMGTYGPGIVPDSTAYLEIADNLVKGNGLENDRGTLVSLWPPLYSLMLAGLSLLIGCSTLTAAKIISLTGAFVCMSVVSSFFIKRNISLFGSLFVYLILWCSTLWNNFSFSLSETLFLPLLALFLVTLERWLGSKQRSVLAILAVITALMFLTRYATIGIMTGVFFVILMHGSSKRKVLYNLFLFYGLVLLMFLPWPIFLYLNSTHPIREFTINLLEYDHHIFRAIVSIGRWIVPEYTRYILIPVLILAGIAFSKLKNTKTLLRSVIADPFTILAIAYIIFLLTVITFRDRNIPLDNRTLAPLYLILFFILAQHLRKVKITPLILIIGVIISFSSLAHRYNFYRESRLNGIGFLSRSWNSSPTVQRSMELVGERNICSNAPLVFRPRLESSEKIYEYPRSLHNSTGDPNPGFRKEKRLLFNSLASDETILVWFTNKNPHHRLDSMFIRSDKLKRIDLSDGFIIMAK